MFIKKDTYGVGTGRLRKLRVLSAIIVGCCVLFINTAGVAANGSVHTESEKKPEPIAEGEVSAALLAEVGTGRVVYEYNSEEKLPAAGLTRLAALVSVCKGFDEGRLKPGDAVSVSEKAAGIGGTTAFLKAGEQMDAETMLLAAVMINAGDATHCSRLRQQVRNRQQCRKLMRAWRGLVLKQIFRKYAVREKNCPHQNSQKSVQR